jgi:hypothetical protein
MTGLFRSVVGIPLVLCAALLVGCSKGEVKTYPIPGKLVYQDNSPVPGATLVFQTTVDGKPVAARGTADSEGKFTLTTFEEGDGVVAGEHQVSVSPLPAGDGPAPVKPAVPPVYSDFAASGLKTTVSPETSEIVITIDRDK